MVWGRPEKRPLYQLHARVRCSVMDLVFVGLSIVFFVVSIGYVAACDRLMK
jgi:hypothetical protein